MVFSGGMRIEIVSLLMKQDAAGNDRTGSAECHRRGANEFPDKFTLSAEGRGLALAFDAPKMPNGTHRLTNLISRCVPWNPA
jgi:hypothetical protein